MINLVKRFLKQGIDDEDRYLRLIFLLFVVYSVLNTILSAIFIKSNLLFDLSYTSIIMILAYISYKKLIPNNIVIILFQIVLFYTLIIGYTLANSLAEGLIFIVIFPIFTIYLNSKLSHIIFWTLSYYTTFILVNLLNLSNNNINLFNLIEIVFLHTFISLAIGYYLYISYLKTRLLKIRQIKLKKNKNRLALSNTKMKELNYKLEKLSRTDGLTGLNNRRTLFEILDKKIELFKRKQISFALILVDIDHFKKVNDEHGHLKGDEILRQVSSAQKSMLRSIDDIGRYGGEEFIILLQEDSTDNIFAFLERLIDGVKQNVKCKDKSVTISAGATIVNKDDTRESFIHRADEALYEAKNTGRDRFVFSEI